MLQSQTQLEIASHGAGLYEFTNKVRRFVENSDINTGQITLFCRHTSCSLLIQENADPDVQIDLQNFFHRFAPPSNDPSMSFLRHTLEGPDDMPAHIKAAVMPVSLTIPIHKGALVLGTWQGIYLFEHRKAAHRRQIFAHIWGQQA